MPRRKVIYSAAALEELAEILTYIIQSSDTPRTAHAYLDRIRARCRKLPDAPFIGADRSDLATDTRTLPFESIVIAFEVHGESIRIRRIFGAAQDYHRHLRSDDDL